MQKTNNVHFFLKLSVLTKKWQLEGMWWGRLEWKIFSSRFPQLASYKHIDNLETETIHQVTGLPSCWSCLLRGPAPLSVWVLPSGLVSSMQGQRFEGQDPSLERKHQHLLFLPGSAGKLHYTSMVWTHKEIPLPWHHCHFSLRLTPSERCCEPALFHSLFWKQEISDILQLAKGFGKVILLEEL